MDLTGFLLCDPKALAPILRCNIVILGIVPQTTGEKRVGRILFQMQLSKYVERACFKESL
jgi:hypothetical protein